MVTDLHYADIDTRGTRHYRESADKLLSCINTLNPLKPDFLIELGDFKDQGTPPDEQYTLRYLEVIESVFKTFEGPRYHVLGNHDMDSLSKQQFMDTVKNANIPHASTHYSFDVKGVHMVVLDANYNSDGTDYDHGNYDWTDANINPDQLAWLEHDLALSPFPAIIFVHQLLDGSGKHYINNSEAVRAILQKHKVLAVFQGHQHAGQYNQIEGIHYYTLKAMVEGGGPDNSSFALVQVHKNYDISITGYKKAESLEL